MNHDKSHCSISCSTLALPLVSGARHGAVGWQDRTGHVWTLGPSGGKCKTNSVDNHLLLPEQRPALTPHSNVDQKHKSGGLAAGNFHFSTEKGSGIGWKRKRKRTKGSRACSDNRKAAAAARFVYVIRKGSSFELAQGQPQR